MQAPGQEKSQTLSTSVADSQSRVRYFYIDIKYFYSQYTNKQYTAGSGLSWNLKLIRKIVELLLERFSPLVPDSGSGFHFKCQFSSL